MQDEFFLNVVTTSEIQDRFNDYLISLEKQKRLVCCKSTTSFLDGMVTVPTQVTSKRLALDTEEMLAEYFGYLTNFALSNQDVCSEVQFDVDARISFHYLIPKEICAYCDYKESNKRKE